MLPKLSKLHDDAQVLFFMATNHQRNFDEAIKRPGRFDLLICMAPPLWTEKIKELEKFWTGAKEEGDVKFVQDRLAGWVPPNHRLVEMLDLFTFSEFKSFLESIRKGETLKTAISRMDEAEFSRNVQEWGENYIALNSKDKEKPRRDLSLREEFEEDKHTSSIQ